MCKHLELVVTLKMEKWTKMTMTKTKTRLSLACLCYWCCNRLHGVRSEQLRGEFGAKWSCMNHLVLEVRGRKLASVKELVYLACCFSVGEVCMLLLLVELTGCSASRVHPMCWPTTDCQEYYIDLSTLKSEGLMMTMYNSRRANHARCGYDVYKLIAAH